MQTIKNALSLVRWPNCLLTMATVITAALLLPRIPPLFKIVLAALSASLIAAYGNIHNDLVDWKADLINHPERPLPQGNMTGRTAARMAVLCVVSGLIIAFMINWRCLILVVSAAALLFAYNCCLKRIPILSNALIAILGMVTFLFGGFLDPSFNAGRLSLVLLGAAFAFWFHLAREIIKDFQDAEGDLAAGIHTLANSFPALGKGLVSLSILGLFGVFIYFHIFLKPGIYFQVIFLFGIMIPLLVMAVWLWRADHSRQHGRIAVFMKLLMPVGLAALLSARFWN